MTTSRDPNASSCVVRSIWLAIALLGPTPYHASTSLLAAEFDFARDIAPIIQTHCISCHYPGHEKGEISLATLRDLSDAEYVVAGKPEESYLIDLVTTSETGERPAMPKEGTPLSEDQVRLLKEWIRQGAQWPAEVVVTAKPKADRSWWSLQALSHQPPGEIQLTGHALESRQILESWKAGEIDRYLAARMQQKGLVPNSRADKRTLIRRLTYDLTGLPPTPQELDDFDKDDSANAYEKVVDRLLASPHYGERWARHWLDVVRFGESTGYEQNIIINDAWPFRDYVIESFNADRPFDQFIREHIAGDLFEGRAANIGSAFLVLGAYDTVGNQDPVLAAQIRANTIDEMIRATSEAFLGLSVGCARCHDHKFDPIEQKDYYRMYATFAAVQHGSETIATDDERKARQARIAPLQKQVAELEAKKKHLVDTIDGRARNKANEYAERWWREKTNRVGTEETFAPVEAKFVKFICEGRDDRPASTSGFKLDEFEVWSDAAESQNVALASSGAVASGPSRNIEDFPGAYGPQLAIDGGDNGHFISASNYFQVKLARPVRISKIRFSSARNQPKPEQGKFVFVSEYRIEVSVDGEIWTEVANSHDRKPVSDEHRTVRFARLETTPEEAAKIKELSKRIRNLQNEINRTPKLPTAWIGNRKAGTAKGPFHVFLGGSPQRKGASVVPASLSTLGDVMQGFAIEDLSDETMRRRALADWIANDDNVLTSRVLANRVWHYHFGTGLVSTPNDFGYMGSRPSHPLLLDFLARKLVDYDWRLKPLHKLIVMSEAYRQSSEHRQSAADIDADSRLLWRFPPRRLSAEEVRDSMLTIAGKLKSDMGGPGFRLYKYLRDNVATYVPLDAHGEETYRRGVYHQNARACTTDLFSEFDQPDCAFSAARRVETTTPLQALTSLNHSFAIDMASAFAERLVIETEVARDPKSEQVQLAYRWCFARLPNAMEKRKSRQFLEQHSLAAFCRALLNASEFLYIR